MSIYDQKQRRAHAMALFEIAEREQQLAGIAIRQTMGTESPPILTETLGSGDPGLGLGVIDRGTEHSIVQAHLQLREAREKAARLAAGDPELTRLHAVLEGSTPLSSAAKRQTQDYEVVDAELVELVDLPGNASNPRLPEK